MRNHFRACFAFWNCLTLVHITHVVVVHVTRVQFTFSELENIVALSLVMTHYNGMDSVVIENLRLQNNMELLSV